MAPGRSSAIFKYIRELKEGSVIPSTMFMGSVSASSVIDKAMLFNKYFHSVFTVSDFRLTDQISQTVGTHSLTSIEFDQTDVYRELVSLDVSKSMGLDGIGPSVLKYCALALHEPLHHLFQIEHSSSHYSHRLENSCNHPYSQNWG